MKFSANWLREIVDPNVSNQKIVEQLTMAGLEVEAINPACINFSGVVTAKIIEVTQHPDADKLKVCTVESQNESLQIVCGDPTVSVGSTVALARVGAKLQNGEFKIKKSKLRGVESFGMLCSLKELGLAETSQGIWVMPESTELDQDLHEYLSLNDDIIELSLTPNRGDCFNLRGIAREVAVINNTNFEDPVAKQKENFNNQDDNLVFDIRVDNTDACPVYEGRVIRNLDPNAVTPLWMQERLRRSGIRSLYPLVDVTNYIMLEFGQPMHAFDLACLKQGIIVRNAKAKEKIKLLDETELELSEHDLLICDHDGPLALAGVKGGDHSGIDDHTTDVFLESAFFNPEYIARTARRYNIITDSSQRYERGVDPNLTRSAINRATELLLEIAGTKDTVVGKINKVAKPGFVENLSKPEKHVVLRESRVAKILGLELDSSIIQDILLRLGLELINKKEVNSDVEYHWQVPSHRFDISIEEDLLEELARIYGYNNIPNKAPKRDLVIKPKQPEVQIRQKIREVLSRQGYSETLNYSFIDSSLQKYFSKINNVLKLINPISSEMGELRLSLVPGLIKVAEYNINHQVDSLKLYEMGKCFYLDSNGDVIEHNKLAGILVGKASRENWDHKSRKVDFYDAKRDLEVLFTDLGMVINSEAIRFEPVNLSDSLLGLHPGQTANISYQDKYIGWVGASHPSLKKKTDLDNAVILFELNLDELKIPSYNHYKGISKFPQIRRDLAFLFKNEIKMQDLYDIVVKLAGDLLRDLYIFDIYTGEGVPEGHKSIAFAMVLQHQDKTLVDAEVNAVIDSIIETVEQKLGGKLRE